MPILSPKIVQCLIKEGPIVAPLALWVWSHAYRRPDAVGVKDPLGVRVDGIKGAAELLGASPRTVERHWPRFQQLFEKGEDGLTRPRAGAWPEPSEWPRTREGFCRYLQIGSSSVVRIMKMKGGRAAWSAQRLALSLLSPGSAAKARGRSCVSLSSGLLHRWLGMSKTAQRSAVDRLRRCGLVTLASSSPRKMAVSSQLLTDRSSWSDLGFQQPVEKPVETESAGLRTKYPPSYRGIKREYENKAPKAPDLNSEIQKSASVFQQRLPGLSRKAALQLAAACPGEQNASDWLDLEAALISEARSPAGAFLWAFRTKRTRPGRSSKAFSRQASEKEELRRELMIATPRTEEEKRSDQREAALAKRSVEFLAGPSDPLWVSMADVMRRAVGAYDFKEWIETCRAVRTDNQLQLVTLDAAAAEAVEAYWGAQLREATGLRFEVLSADSYLAAHSGRALE